MSQGGKIFDTQDITMRKKGKSIWYSGHCKEGSWGESPPWEGREGKEGEEMPHLWDEGAPHDDDYDAHHDDDGDEHGGGIDELHVTICRTRCQDDIRWCNNGVMKKVKIIQILLWRLNLLDSCHQSYPEDSVTVGDLHYHKVGLWCLNTGRKNSLKFWQLIHYHKLVH